jgi:catechol 2,3-dioxygenase-like lactoylglutathione lyase family enzyme
MITGLHTMFYSSDPEGLRAFLRDTLRFPSIDAGEGWLIFAMPPAEMGCHPAEKEDGQAVPSGTPYLAFMCDDVQQTRTELASRGVEFVDDVTDVGYGLATHFRMPGDFTVELYQPRYTPPRGA